MSKFFMPVLIAILIMKRVVLRMNAHVDLHQVKLSFQWSSFAGAVKEVSTRKKGFIVRIQRTRTKLAIP